MKREKEIKHGRDKEMAENDEDLIDEINYSPLNFNEAFRLVDV
jgi:hypothetical protein